jgi:4-hydroxythreonine-4-phosphate dehydrogenase
MTTKRKNECASETPASSISIQVKVGKEIYMSDFKPITAITMGDPAGIGPETVIGTMLDKELYQSCKLFVIGSIAILERAKDVLHADVSFRKITDPSEAKYEYGIIDVLETGEYDTDSIEWGKVQKLAGQMAYDFILKSIQLGLEGKLDAVSTTPINKQSIKLIGVKEPGHTEIYQNETKSPYALTMFSCHKLRVFFLSRHISLVDAVHYATKDRVVEYVEWIDRELRNVGIKNPKIAVAGINPHNGDNGLFGTEEKTDLFPAVEQLTAEGINAVGPIPADSIFMRGKKGEFDAILSMYHDQGHIACKTLDFDKSVTITWGLPFIRGSVDHGTAFDIAGKGIASYISLVESTKVCVEYTVRKHEMEEAMKAE